jgi:hypothetical protein
MDATTINNNTLIAEFMGWKKLNHGFYDWEKPKEGEVRYSTNDQHRWYEEGVSAIMSERDDHDVRYMGFDESWEWLMPVVEKIESIDIVGGLIINSFSFRIDRAWVQIEMHPQIDIGFNFDNQLGWSEDIEHFGDTRMEAVYGAVVKFINWYNSNNSK